MFFSPAPKKKRSTQDNYFSNRPGLKEALDHLNQEVKKTYEATEPDMKRQLEEAGIPHEEHVAILNNIRLRLQGEALVLFKKELKKERLAITEKPNL